MANKPMMGRAIPAPVEDTDPRNDQSLINRVGRIYDKQQELRFKLLMVNSIIINGGVEPIVEPTAFCVVDYLQEIENTLDDTMCLAEHILSITK